jgi:hypothetical protein
MMAEQENIIRLRPQALCPGGTLMREQELPHMTVLRVDLMRVFPVVALIQHG